MKEKGARVFFFSPPSSLLRGDHLQHEVDDGVGGLLRVHLGEEVADVVRRAALLPGHKAEEPGGEERARERTQRSGFRGSGCC